MKHGAALIWVSFLIACSGGGSSTNGGTEAGGHGGDPARTLFSACESPRPQACTREYAPVCAQLDDGQMRTYDNGCTACADGAVHGHYPTPCASPAMTACQDPRPQVCTLDYRPVCGQLATGETRTYGNACAACGDSAVIGSFPGECAG